MDETILESTDQQHRGHRIVLRGTEVICLDCREKIGDRTLADFRNEQSPDGGGTTTH